MKCYMHIIVGILLLLACTKSEQVEIKIPEEEVQEVDTTLQNLSPFPFGAAVNVNLLRTREAYRNLVIEEYNSITSENALKLHFLRRESSEFNWTDADYIVDFAEEYDKRIHGHTLVWHNNLPNWVVNFEGDEEAWEHLFKTHIQTVVTRYKGRVGSWDVVNEALDNDGHGLRNSLWLTKLGPGYIARAFHYAHEADPDALLFYNDYGNEYGPTKRNAIINLVKDLQNQGVPIHGVGMQMHTRFNREDSFHAAAIQNTAQETGLLLHISELDIAVNPNNDQNLIFTPQLAAQQAAKYRHIVSTFGNIPENQQFGITTWNVSDADSWIPGHYNRPDWPLPFDNNYNRKPAYYGIVDGF